MMARRRAALVWREVSWPRPFDPDAALHLLGRLSADRRTATIVWEARGDKEGIRHLVGCSAGQMPALSQIMTSHVTGVRLSTGTPRSALTRAVRIRLSSTALALSTERVMGTVRSMLAGLAAANSEHELVILQVMLGPRVAPSVLSDHPDDPRATWLERIMGNVRPASAEIKAGMKRRAGSAGFKAIIRLGASAGTPRRERDLIGNLFGGLKVAESAGAHLRLVAESAKALDAARKPWRWPLQLSVPELVCLMGWPLGDGSLPGVVEPHPKVLPPPQGMRDSDRPFAISAASGETVLLGISARDSLQHTVLLGPTGTGKSNAMLSIIVADIAAGRGVLLIDPKSDLTLDVLARIPESRRGDVVVIDPADSRPVGLNPLVGRHQNPALVADGVITVFKELFADSWGPRTQDILSSAVLTLALYPRASLVWLPTLLTDARFRHKLTRGITDRIGLGPFWAAYEAMSVSQRAQAIAPVMNKLRQFLLRPALRSVLGQTEPLFELSDLFDKRRIVLISLNKGLIGSEGARLLGSLVVAQLWPLVLARASLAPQRRHIVSVFIDEVQDYLRLPTDLADALSQARGLGVGFTIAHQYRSQLSPILRAGVDANARNKIVFGLNATDAHDMAAMAPGLEARDFMLLPRYGVYAHLMNGGQSTGWISGRTLPAPPAISDPLELKAASARSFGRPAEEIEAEVLEAIGLATDGATPEEEGEQVGRRLRRRP